MPKPYVPCRNPAVSTHQLVENGRAIKFSPCGITSWNGNDVMHRYCGLCKRVIPNEAHQPKPEDPVRKAMSGRPLSGKDIHDLVRRAGRDPRAAMLLGLTKRKP